MEYVREEPVYTCRECGSANIYSKEVKANGGHGPSLLPLGFFHSSKFSLRVCSECGLVDWYVSPDSLGRVPEYFEREP